MTLSSSLPPDAPNNAVPYRLAAPTPCGPIVVSSPHSGRDYPEAFVEASILDAHKLRQSEDMYVDDLFAGAPEAGACLLAARYPRAFVDLNRSIHEIDLDLVDGDFPAHRDQSLPRVQAGLGVIPRIVAEDTPIYRDTLSSVDVENRIEKIYQPFHDCLGAQLERARAACGYAVLIDAHSMPAQAGRAIAPANKSAALDIVIGNCHDTACAPELSTLIGNFLKQAGYTVSFNRPYAGGFITSHYGQPHNNQHAIQIEINRSLYMDEAQYTKTANFDILQRDLTQLVVHLQAELSRQPLVQLAPPPAHRDPKAAE